MWAFTCDCALYMHGSECVMHQRRHRGVNCWRRKKKKKKKILGQKKCNIYLVQETSEDEQNIQKELQLLKSSIDKHSLQRVEDKTINYKNI